MRRTAALAVAAGLGAGAPAQASSLTISVEDAHAARLSATFGMQQPVSGDPFVTTRATFGQGVLPRGCSPGDPGCNSAAPDLGSLGQSTPHSSSDAVIGQVALFTGLLELSGTGYIAGGAAALIGTGPVKLEQLADEPATMTQPDRKPIPATLALLGFVVAGVGLLRKWIFSRSAPVAADRAVRLRR